MIVTAHSAQAAIPVARPHSAAAGGDAPRQAALRDTNPEAQNPKPDQSVPPTSVDTRVQEQELRDRERLREDRARRDAQRTELASYREVASSGAHREAVERTA